jgi:hypothetical protein
MKTTLAVRAKAIHELKEAVPAEIRRDHPGDLHGAEGRKLLTGSWFSIWVKALRWCWSKSEGHMVAYRIPI